LYDYFYAFLAGTSRMNLYWTSRICQPSANVLCGCQPRPAQP